MELVGWKEADKVLPKENLNDSGQMAADGGEGRQGWNGKGKADGMPVGGIGLLWKAKRQHHHIATE
jgi:hypothetical protein